MALLEWLMSTRSDQQKASPPTRMRRKSERCRWLPTLVSRRTLSQDPFHDCRANRPSETRLPIMWSVGVSALVHCVKGGSHGVALMGDEVARQSP